MLLFKWFDIKYLYISWPNAYTWVDSGFCHLMCWGRGKERKGERVMCVEVKVSKIVWEMRWVRYNIKCADRFVVCSISIYYVVWWLMERKSWDNNFQHQYFTPYHFAFLFYNANTLPIIHRHTKHIVCVEWNKCFLWMPLL